MESATLQLSLIALVPGNLHFSRNRKHYYEASSQTVVN